MDTATLLPALCMTTLGLTLLVIVVGFAIYWRKRSNRAPRDGGTPTDDGSVWPRAAYRRSGGANNQRAHPIASKALADCAAMNAGTSAVSR